MGQAIQGAWKPSLPLMKVSVEKKIVLGFAASVLALIGMGWLSYHTTANFIATEKLVSHTHEVVATLESGLAILTKMETEQRSYLLSGDGQFLKDCQNEEAQVGGWTDKIRKLTADNPEQQQRLDKLEALISERLVLLNNRIKLRQERGLQAAVDDASSFRGGRRVMDQIWDGIAEMHEAESQLLTQRELTANQNARVSLIIILVGSALACAVGLTAIVWIRHDLKLRAQAEAELDRFFTLSLDCLCIASADGYFKRVNPAITDILGWSVGEFLSRPFISFVHPDDREATLREVEKQVVTGQKVLHFENRYQHKDGSWRVLSWRSIPQAPGSMYATARDVTEQKRVEAEMKRREHELKAVNQELEAFSYSVSHDLRAPLRHIDGFVKLLEKRASERLDDNGKRFLGIIADAAKSMGALIDDLLVFSRMGRAELRRTKVSPESLVHEVVGALQSEIRGRRIDWQLGALPRVEADPAMLRQVWTNLISNAVKYTRPRNLAEIEIGCNAVNGEFVFHIHDNGVGFDMEYAHKLFGVFQRLHHSKDFEGTGIGLANVQRIIHRHGGRVWAEGKVDSGATFYFSLPRTQTQTKG